VFLPLEAEGPLADTLHLELREEPGVSLAVSGAGPDVPHGPANLAQRAAEAWLARAGGGGATLRLEKRVPAGAGLGGGSSDAGAVLRGLAALRPGCVAPSALLELALGLGADVPFFLDPRPAQVAGIGERVEPLAAAPRLPLLVVWPGLSLATAEVYGAFAALRPALTEPPRAPTFPALPPRPGELAPAAWAERVRNDLEPAASRLCPRIAELRAALLGAGALAAAMSGSGAAVYGVFEDDERRDRAIEQLNLAPPERVFATASQASPRGA
jgi:4-diphosphocytidyl-2-C-methyl-D-erythritol kinase